MKSTVRLLLSRIHQDRQGRAGQRRRTRVSIVPGMVANVDIHTGEKTVLEYLVKPFNKARRHCVNVEAED